MNKSIEYQNVGEKIIAWVPEFKTQYEEHLKDNDELLPHVLMGDFTRFFINTFQISKKNEDKKAVLARCVKLIDSLFDSEDPMIQELAQVSFIENLQGENDLVEIKKLFGEKTQKSFDLVFRD